MNIYILDKDPKKCAAYYCDMHISSYCLRLAQSLSIAHWYSYIATESPPEKFRTLKDAKNYFYDKYPEGSDKRPPYKISNYFIKHDSIDWLASEEKNYFWTISLLEAMCNEFFILSNKQHASVKFINWFKNNIPITCKDSKDYSITFVKEVPEEFKHLNIVDAYRSYYKTTKRKIAKWDRSKKPEWF